MFNKTQTFALCLLLFAQSILCGAGDTFAQHFCFNWTEGVKYISAMTPTTFDRNKGTSTPPPLFNENIDPRIFTGSHVVIGQWGSGKTLLSESIKSQLHQSSMVVEPLQQKTKFTNTIFGYKKLILHRIDLVQRPLSQFKNVFNRLYQKQREIFDIEEKSIQNSDAYLIEHYWRDSDMVDFTMGAIIEKLLLSTDNKLLISALQSLNQDLKLKIADIASLYAIQGDIEKLKTFMKLLFKDEVNKKSSIIFGKIEFISLDSCNYSDLEKLSQYFESIEIIQENFNDKAGIICSYRKFLNRDITPDLPLTQQRTSAWFNDLQRILDTARISIYLIFDGIDEIESLGITSHQCQSGAFGRVIKSLKPMLDVAAINQNFIKTLIFIPHCGNQGSEIILPDWRRDKVPIVHLTWSKPMLSRYGEFILQGFRELQKCHWPYKFPIPNFTQFLGGSHCQKLFIDVVQNPREFNQLFNSLITELVAQQTNTLEKFVGGSNCEEVISAIATFKQFKKSSEPSTSESKSGSSNYRKEDI